MIASSVRLREKPAFSPVAELLLIDCAFAPIEDAALPPLPSGPRNAPSHSCWQTPDASASWIRKSFSKTLAKHDQVGRASSRVSGGGAADRGSTSEMAPWPSLLISIGGSVAVGAWQGVVSEVHGRRAQEARPLLPCMAVEWSSSMRSDSSSKPASWLWGLMRTDYRGEAGRSALGTACLEGPTSDADSGDARLKGGEYG